MGILTFKNNSSLYMPYIYIYIYKASDHNRNRIFKSKCKISCVSVLLFDTIKVTVRYSTISICKNKPLIFKFKRRRNTYLNILNPVSVACK